MNLRDKQSEQLTRYSRILLLLLADAVCINFSYILAFLMRFEFSLSSDQAMGYFMVYLNDLFWLTAIKLIIYWVCGLYNSLWRYAGTEELVKVLFVTVAANAMSISYLRMTQQFLPRGISAIVTILDILLIGGVRLGYRTLRNMRSPGNFDVIKGRRSRNVSESVLGSDVIKVMLVGAGDAGATMIKEMRMHPENGKKVVVAIDDDPAKVGKRIAGVKIAGGRSDIKKTARKYGVDEIIIAIPSAPKKEVTDIVAECNKTRCKLKILPALIDLINEKVSVNTLRDVDIEDLLGREAVQVNLKEISGYLEGRIVMVTGGGGSIGSELCRQIARFKPRRLIALDIYENSVFELSNEIHGRYPQLEFNVVITSVRDYARLEEAFEKYKPHVVFHAAAHKHVPLMEGNPKEAVVNNILGTKNLIDLSDRYAVDKFVLISTDKAVNPTNVMGATKRVAEMMLQEKSAHSRTSYSAVRFGNVLGSNGSVIPIFRRQIAQGGPVTVTHPEICRYFMTIPEAVQLVIQAGAMAQGGEIFILDMGDPVKIMDLAENIIRLSGFVPYEDIDIKITGLRPGEKLYEELLLAEEGIRTTSHNKIYVGHPVPPSEALSELLAEENGVAESVEEVVNRSPEEVKEWLNRLVPNYNRKSGGN
ncbi:polysaccharide biosynthesis protein [Bacilliculturomica massiliensis]|uniref:polysaccharide biosynthesis protein n=1 Tax=Bacilliculturomica massiliensis TaxID=1917867 RepID=UPI001031D25F|nr:nucleoside-diphosphate sugar epimerase/dehydratase [Bacilliculturomica massiliensis]